jgi:hypothetical protein
MTSLVRASEIGAFAFCERAWGYAAQGKPSERELEIEAGQQLHAHRLQRAAWSQAVRRIGAACLLLAIAALTIALMT